MIRPDRFRTDYADGRIVAMTDPAGVELRYLYQPVNQSVSGSLDFAPPTPALSVPGSGLALSAVYEPASCTLTSSPTPPATGPTQRNVPSSCRAFRFGYLATKTATVSTDCRGPDCLPVIRGYDAARTDEQVTVTDPAGRLTRYLLGNTANNGTGGVTGGTNGSSYTLLRAVYNIDGSTVNYTYNERPATSCGGDYGRLCSITDGRGAVTRVGYEPPRDTTAAQLGATFTRCCRPGSPR